jgi:Thioredoxin like C-terminal domain
MRPERENIAAPDLPEGIAWVGEAPRSMPLATAGGPVLVHFFDFAQLNSVRTLPYVSGWARRYAPHGLTTIGVQAPRFPFGAERETVAAGLKRLGVDFPVAIDADRHLWQAYGCEGWPSLFLWKLGGALSWFHFGEGEYRASEEAIQAELREADALRALPEPMEPLRPTDAPGAKVMPPTPELFPGGSWEQPWTAGEDGEELEAEYEAGGAYVTVEGTGKIAITIDGGSTTRIEIDGPGLYKLTDHPQHEQHTISLRPSQGLQIWSLSFAAGVPPAGGGGEGSPRG